MRYWYQIIRVFLAIALLTLAGNAHAETFTVIVPIHNGGTLAEGLEQYHVLEGVGDGIRLAYEYYLDEFDDDSFNATLWSANTQNGGSITESGTTLVIDNSGGDTEGAFLVAKDTIDRTEPFHFTVRAKKATDTKWAYIPVILRKTGEPTPADLGLNIMGVAFKNDGTFYVNYVNSGSTTYSWTGTEWTDPGTFIGTYSANTYYETHIISDGTSWYIEIRDASGDLLHTTESDSIAWADTRAPAGDDDWFVVYGHAAIDWRAVITVDSIKHAGGDYYDTSPATTDTFTSLVAGTLDMSTARLVVFKSGAVQAAGSTDVKCKMKSNGGSLGGTWLTMTGIRALSDITVTDTTDSVGTSCQLNSDGSYETATKYKMEIDFTPSAATDYPAIGDVESGVSYNFGSSTGTFTEPGIGNVEEGVQYGGGGIEFTGTFVVPGVGFVNAGTTYGDSEEFTGTFVGGADVIFGM